MRKEILCTLGPASVNERVITRLESFGVNLFRINLSHTKLEDLPGVIKEIQKYTRVPICLDTEGAQVRTGNLVDKEVSVKENGIVFIHRNSVPGDAHNFNFYPKCVFDELVPGDFISIDFNSVLVQVIDIEKNRIAMRVLNGGKIGQNKAVSVERDIPLPVLTAKDREALKIGAEMGIRHVALSFANRASDVAEIRAAAPANAFIISKIETRNGLLNLDEIAKASDSLLIDRGDLSRQEPIERIPKLQKTIIARGKAAGKKVYVATNLLESMVTSNRPTRAEVNDVYNTLLDGADGLVLAAETAIGKNPIGCASMIVKLIHEFENAGSEKPYFYYPEDPCSLLVEPHGGLLVHREIHSAQEADFFKLSALPVDDMTLMECAQIAFGTYSPLTGFMNRETLQSVVDTYRLPGGDVWPMPIVLQIEESKAKKLSRGQRVVLTSAQGTAHALLDINDVYTMDLDALAKKWFKTNAPEHPGVARLNQNGPWFVGGDITLIKKLDSLYHQYELTPAQCRYIFTHKGWSRVVGFHTRNVIHRVHEHIQMKALELSHADGLYINPVIGPRKKGDFLPEPVIKSYQIMMDFGLYANENVTFGCFPTYPRYCGPREAVFTAICRKNMGCSHFIVGRNHAGVGDYYEDSEYQQLFESLGDLGVVPIFFDAMGYDIEKQRYEALTPKGNCRSISGTQVRNALLSGQALPDWFIRREVQEMLLADISSQKPVFQS